MIERLTGGSVASVTWRVRLEEKKDVNDSSLVQLPSKAATVAAVLSCMKPNSSDRQDDAPQGVFLQG